MRALVTGGAGYIGAHVVRTFAAAGYDVLILDDFRSSKPDRALGFDVVPCALEDNAAVMEAFRTFRPTVVAHLAGSISVAESVRNPGKYWNNNVNAPSSLLRACNRFTPESFVFASTAAVYGEVPERPIPETTRLQPTSPYGDSKRVFEEQLRRAALGLGMKGVALRFFNACGAHPAWGVGEDHEPEEHLIPRVIRAQLAGDEMSIFGADYSTPDGTCVRDYVHVLDLAAAHLAVVEADLPNWSAFNVGTGAGYSVLEIASEVSRRLGRELRYRVGPRRSGDPAFLVADASRLAAETSWRAQHSTLEEIVRSAVDWELSKVKSVAVAV